PGGGGGNLDVVLRVLGDPTRLRLFRALRSSERCVRALVEAEGLSQPLVSHHLRVLQDAGLVRSRRWEGFVLYAVAPDGLEAAGRALAELFEVDRLSAGALPGGNTHCCR
ncbi:MAG: ArsR/SmtB family transcription factor, partial [Acidimicrobiales bacterium]